MNSRIRKDFPILKEKVYLNNAAYAPIPLPVIKEISNFLMDYSIKGPDSPSIEIEEIKEKCREKVAKFIGAKKNEIVFTESVTEGINIVANGLRLNKGDSIVLREGTKDHAANFLPWLKVCKDHGANLEILGSDNLGLFDLEKLKKIKKRTKLVSITHGLYNLGTILPIEKIGDILSDHDTLFFVDAAQTVGFIPIDVKKIKCDFLAFPGSKWICGPPGIGVLYISEDASHKINTPGMDVRSVKQEKKGPSIMLKITDKDYELRDLPYNFEIGFRNYLGMIGLARSIDYIKKIGLRKMWKYNMEMMEILLDFLSEYRKIKLYGPKDPKKQTTVVPFNIKDVKPDKVVSGLEKEDIIVALREIGFEKIIRISSHFFNNKEDLEKLISCLSAFI